MTCIVNAIPNNSQFMIAPSLQQDFINKDTGELLAAGVVTFYRDVDHTQLKPVYAVSGPPDSPIFTELPNPLILSAIGTFIDPSNNQDIIPYYKPYDDDGNVDLYYITVYSSDNILQFTRDHYPTVPASNNENIVTVENFIPNGQFLLHLDLPNSGAISGSSSIVDIAYGGWIYQQNSGTASTNIVTFPRYNSPITSPDQNPRYAVELNCTSASPSDSMKDIGNVITDVNFMQGQDLTFQVTAYSNDGNSHNIEFVIQKNYGTGGSPQTEEIISVLTVTAEIQNFLVSFTMSGNAGQTLGALNDDNIVLILRSPLATTSDIIYTNCMLVEGTFAELIYPPTTPEQDKDFTIPASFDIPAYDGSNSGNAVILGTTTQNVARLGFIYTPIPPVGAVLPYIGATAPDGFILGNGAEYSVDVNTGFSRYPNLFNLILSISTGGTSSDGYVVSGTYAFGTGRNGFEYVATGSNTLSVYWNRFDVAQPAPDPGTSGFSFLAGQAWNAYPANLHPRSYYANKQIYSQTVIAGSAITAGSYYRLIVNTTGSPFTQMFWMTVDGVGNIPTSVTYDIATKIAILSTDTVTQVRDKIIKYANGIWQSPDLRYSIMSFYGFGALSSTINRYSSQTYAYSGSGTQYDINYSTGNQNDSIGSNIYFAENANISSALYPVNLNNSNPNNLLIKNFNAIIKT